MRKCSYTYTVLDTKTGQIILTDADINKVTNSIGINRYKIHPYAINKYKFRGRYAIEAKEIPYVPKIELPVYVDKEFTSKDKAFMKIFDQSMEALKKNYTKDTLQRIVIVERQAV